jgi:hypothetical protein
MTFFTHRASLFLFVTFTELEFFNKKTQKDVFSRQNSFQKPPELSKQKQFFEMTLVLFEVLFFKNFLKEA